MALQVQFRKETITEFVGGKKNMYYFEEKVIDFCERTHRLTENDLEALMKKSYPEKETRTNEIAAMAKHIWKTLGVKATKN